MWVIGVCAAICLSGSVDSGGLDGKIGFLIAGFDDGRWTEEVCRGLGFAIWVWLLWGFDQLLDRVDDDPSLVI